MRKILFLPLLLVAVLATAQTNPNLGLIPTPQQVQMQPTSKVNTLHKVKLKEQQVAALPVQVNADQGYQLELKNGKATLRYTHPTGKANGLRTWQQLLLLHDTLPNLTITDWPAYKYRLWMDDQSRGPVPHIAYRQLQRQRLDALKYNYYNYYTEHTLYQPEYPDLAPAPLGYLDTIVDTAEVINLQLFAHAEKTLRIPFYEYLMDSRANFNPGQRSTYDFLGKRIRAAINRLPHSHWFIIDCDETEQLGTGRAANLVSLKGADQVYTNHIKRLYDTIQQYDKQVVMWGDIVAKNPDMIRKLPPDIIYIMWAYEPLDSYDHLLQPFQQNATTFWVAPSLSHSSNMCPNPYKYMQNIANLARDGYRAGAEGFINTCWDDNGEALFDNCWHGLFWGAEMAWNPIRTNEPAEFQQRQQQFNQNFERLFYKHHTTGKERTLVSQLYALGALEQNPLVADWYTGTALNEPLVGFNPDNTSDAMRTRTQKVLQLLDTLAIDSANNPHAHYAAMRIRAIATKNQLRIAIHDALQTTSPSPKTQRDIQQVKTQYLRQLTNLKHEYLRLWDQENGEYERHIVCNRFDQLARELLDIDQHVFFSTSTPATNSATTTAPLITLRTLFNDTPIYYTLDGSTPDSSATHYTQPFPLQESATITAIAYNRWNEGIITQQYLLSHLGMGASITLRTPFATYKPIYSGGGPQALVDGKLGSNTTYADGLWQGYWGDSIDAVIDLHQTTPLHQLQLRFMQNTFDWILAPTDIEVYTSTDSVNWQLVANQHYTTDPRQTGMHLVQHRIELPTSSQARYLRIVVPNRQKLPPWHPAPGQPAYLFCDEIIIL